MIVLILYMTYINLLNLPRQKKNKKKKKNMSTFEEYEAFKQYATSEQPAHQGPVVQSVVSLTSSLWVISLTVLADSIYNILIFFAE